MVGLSSPRGLPGKWRLALERVSVFTQGAIKIIALLVATVVLVVAGVAYAANGYPAHPHVASNGGDNQGIDDTLLVDGLDGLLGEAEDPEKPPED